MLEILVPAATSNREILVNWVETLLNPAYNVDCLREKRNRYLLMLCLTLLKGNVVDGVFIQEPPTVLLDIANLNVLSTYQANWERDNVWQDEVQQMKKIEKKCPDVLPHSCSIHTNKCPTDDYNNAIGSILDQQFRFFLHLIRPYTALLYQKFHQRLAARWIQKLCCYIPEHCAMSKGIRNDYIMALLGYLSNRMLLGPFQRNPDYKIRPLCEITNDGRPIIDPTHPQIDQLISEMPVPNEGTFAFVAVTGDLYEE